MMLLGKIEAVTQMNCMQSVGDRLFVQHVRSWVCLSSETMPIITMFGKRDVAGVHRRQPRVHALERRRLALIRWLKYQESPLLPKPLFICNDPYVVFRECYSTVPEG